MTVLVDASALVATLTEEPDAAELSGVIVADHDRPARLNMGDCFAYACAKANDARLLSKGDHFSATDLAR